jgi:hypothetical protein
LISRDDKPLSAKEERKAQESWRRNPPSGSANRRATRPSSRRSANSSAKYFREIPMRFVLRVLGVEQISGKPAWVIEAEPR